MRSNEAVTARTTADAVPRCRTTGLSAHGFLLKLSSTQQHLMAACMRRADNEGRQTEDQPYSGTNYFGVRVECRFSVVKRLYL